MVKRLLMYSLISVVSYFAGVFCYLGALRLFYDQGMGSDMNLIWAWIGFPYFFFVVPLYAGIILFLRAIRRYSLILQTIVFLIPGFLAMGAAYFPYGLYLLMNPISKEASLFYCCYTATAILFSCGSWYTEKWLKP
ncbi:hypothetical protein E5161_10680 [Cohnella pontilimi]|uniref:Uncharacterized protein n=1 Tax=Cohnella pontilimi TaxID=2564100 RepID=A0A4U0FCC9_9BACL|nr:hypothetical protein [Cohnella pontilimi]TJY42445.1 hypothetical protein E5161_10680 [Cohnella pontilimi]